MVFPARAVRRRLLLNGLLLASILATAFWLALGGLLEARIGDVPWQALVSSEPAAPPAHAEAERRHVQGLLEGLRATVSAWVLLGLLGCVLAMVLLAERLALRPWRDFGAWLLRLREAGEGPPPPGLQEVADTVLRLLDESRAAGDARLRMLERAVEQSASVIIITDTEGRIEYVNPRFTEVTGYRPEEVLGQTPRILQSGEASAELYRELWRTIKAGREWRGELHNRRKDGTLYWASETIAPIRNGEGRIRHFIAIQEDVTEARELAERLSHQASHDDLTGLPNRREFELRLAALLAEAHRDPRARHAVAFLDLDQFKVVNDTCGHAAGDELLRQVAALMRRQLRSQDLLARLGGDEFGLLLRDCPPEMAIRLLEKLGERLRDFRFGWCKSHFRIGISAGLVPIGPESPDLAELMKQADAACYEAKERGRGRVHLHRAGKGEGGVRRAMAWVERLEQALEQDRLVLHGQEIRPLQGQGRTHYEVLLRMRAEDGSLVGPGEFLPAAERFGLSGRVDRWVLGRLAAMLEREQWRGLEWPALAVNLSGASLGDERTLEGIVELVRREPLSRLPLVFEITETAAITSFSTAQSFMNELHRHGIGFALDDFGSGLSSFGYLQELPIDYLKIDGRFVREMRESAVDAAIVRSVNELAHALGIGTVAEFVEDAGLCRLLWEMGVDYAQGYGIARPAPLEELLTSAAGGSS